MSERPYIPPYSVTDMIIHLIAEISEQVGVVTIKNEDAVNPHLRRDNQIRTIHSSLAIENNTLSLEQVTDVINGKRILGAPNEIREVKNAYEAYNLLLSFEPLSIPDLCNVSIRNKLKEVKKHSNHAGLRRYAPSERLV